jgi:ribulose-phosphate 3-epimerase
MDKCISYLNFGGKFMYILGMAEVIPAVLEKEFAEIEKKIHLVENHVQYVQIDIADESLVPNKTHLEPNDFAKLKTKVNLELHMMVKDPLRYLEKYAQAGFKRFYTQVEGDYVEQYIAKCYELGVEVGLAIDGPTSLDKIHPYLDNIDCLLVMAIQAGFSGQPYREDTADRIRKLKEIDFELPLAVDGAMDEVNARKVVEAGANRICSNSFIFKAEDVSIPINKLKSLQKSVIEELK